MKQLILLSLTAILLLATTNVSAQATPAKRSETKTKVKTQNLKMKVKGDLDAVPMPYPIGYSSQFITGDPAYAKTVLELWKDFDNNTFDRTASAFADTVVMMLTDGTVLRGLPAMMDAMKTYRSSLLSVESTIDAVLSTHSIDRDEDWVLVWGTTKETDKSGTTKTMLLHEAWRLDKDGKVNYMMQYTRAEAKL
jgi:hypothetical protein